MNCKPIFCVFVIAITLLLFTKNVGAVCCITKHREFCRAWTGVVWNAYVCDDCRNYGICMAFRAEHGFDLPDCRYPDDCGVNGCNIFKCNCDGGCVKPIQFPNNPPTRIKGESVVKSLPTRKLDSLDKDDEIVSEPEMFASLDTDSGGYLTFDEVKHIPSMTKEKFKSTDKDGNGKVNMKEFLAA